MNVYTLIGCPVGINHVSSYHYYPSKHSRVISFATSPLRQGKGVLLLLSLVVLPFAIELKSCHKIHECDYPKKTSVYHWSENTKIMSDSMSPICEISTWGCASASISDASGSKGQKVHRCTIHLQLRQHTWHSKAVQIMCDMEIKCDLCMTN